MYNNTITEDIIKNLKKRKLRNVGRIKINNKDKFIDIPYNTTLNRAGKHLVIEASKSALKQINNSFEAINKTKNNQNKFIDKYDNQELIK